MARKRTGKIARVRSAVRFRKPVRVRPAIRLGLVLIAAGVFIFAFTYGKILLQELGYGLRHDVLKVTEVRQDPVDTDFGIMIPKIGANAHVIADVDPYDARAYQRALTRGVAHARGTGVPGMDRNIFLFAHSSVDFYNALRYNSVFYLLNKLEAGDTVYVYYRSIRYPYRVTDIRFADPNAINYMYGLPGRETLTLMTCWPPGTAYKRLLVLAERVP